MLVAKVTVSMIQNILLNVQDQSVGAGSDTHTTKLLVCYILDNTGL